MISCGAADPLPSMSRLMSSMGSVVDVTFPHRSHLTSLCKSPSKVVWTMQMQAEAVLPLDVACIWLRAEMKNSWASCWAYPDSSAGAAFQVVVRKPIGPRGPPFPEYTWNTGLSRM